MRVRELIDIERWDAPNLRNVQDNNQLTGFHEVEYQLRDCSCSSADGLLGLFCGSSGGRIGHPKRAGGPCGGDMPSRERRGTFGRRVR